MSDELVAYIRQNRDRYTREALRHQLVAAGNAPEAVDEAFRLVESEEGGPRLDLRRRAVGITLVAYVLVWLVFGLLIGGGPGIMLILAVYFGVGLLISLVVLALWTGLKHAHPGRAASVLAAGLAIPIAILVGLLGFCVVNLGQFNI